jgi:2-iminoacetate synthase ThiH
MVQVSGLSIREVLVELQKAGLKTIPGGGSEILSNRVKRKISRLFPKGRVDDWTQVHREAHRLGYRTTATMMYGHLGKMRTSSSIWST